MTIRTVCNQNTRTVKRSVKVQASEVALIGGSVSVFTGENHQHLVDYDDEAEKFYPGYEHLPCGEAQHQPLPPVFAGPIPDQNWTQDEEITPLDLSAYFTGTVDTYALSNTAIGLTLDEQTGILSGTPTSVSGGSAIATATNDGGSADSDPFNWTVSAP